MNRERSALGLEREVAQERLLEPVSLDLNRNSEPWKKLRAAHQHERQAWLIKLRWIAIGCVLITVVGASLAGWIYTLPQLLGVTACMAIYNAYFWRRWKLENGQGTWTYEENPVFLPILFDLAALTLLLHWSGGIENPFVLFFAFHMAIGAILLPTRGSYILAAAASLLWGGTILLEYTGTLPHHALHLGSVPRIAIATNESSAIALTGHLIAFGLTLFGVFYFVRSVEQGRWEAEVRLLQRERVAAAREKLARIGEITAGVAHAVRNPLQGVITSLDLMRSTSVFSNPSTIELADIMDQGLRRVERVTRRLLNLTRTKTFAMVATDINQLVVEHRKTLEPIALDRGITIEIKNGELPRMQIDPEAVEEALANITDNAIQACSDGDTILIETRPLAGSVPGSLIRICDSGGGIPADFADKVFDPFFTSKAVGDGCGLGLAISRDIIEKHSGRLRLVEDPNWNTCFEVEFSGNTVGDAVEELVMEGPECLTSN